MNHSRQRPVHLSILRGLAGTVTDIALLHGQWALGLGRFSPLRPVRLQAGVDSNMTAEDLVGEVAHGEHWQFRFALPEASRTERISAVRVYPEQGSVTAEHVVVCRGESKTTGASVPQIVRHLSGGDWSHEVVDDPSEVEALVNRVLDPGRRTPLVLVSVENGTGIPLIDVVGLAGLLTGAANICLLRSVAVCRELTLALQRTGLSPKFGCYNGGVRVLRPGLNAEHDPYEHQLVLGGRIRTLPFSERSAWLAGTFLEVIAEDHDVDRWLIEARSPVAPNTTTPVVAPARDPQPSQSPAPEKTKSGAPEVLVLKGMVVAHRRVAADLSSRLRAAEEEQETAFGLAADVEEESERVRQELDAERRTRRRAQQELDEVLESRWRVKDVTDALGAAEALFAEALSILPTARRSTTGSDFRDPELLFRSLALLALFGSSDTKLQHALEETLGGRVRWRPKDSPETVSRFGDERTWAGTDGARKLFRRHLTLGHGLPTRSCLQVYYDVLGNGRVEVAWVGKHLRTVGQNT